MIQDPDEPGLNGIRAILEDAAGNKLDEEVTGTSRAGVMGHFLFQPLDVGTYTILVDHRAQGPVGHVVRDVGPSRRGVRTRAGCLAP